MWSSSFLRNEIKNRDKNKEVNISYLNSIYATNFHLLSIKILV